jgi:hypothetical protein
MTTGIAAFRIALTQALSFGLSPAPGMIWVTHEDPEAELGQVAASEKRHVSRARPVRLCEQSKPRA